MTGGFALLARFRGASADSLFLTAALTLLGFSVHDTIVVFNRVKANLLRLRLPFRDLADRSVVETMPRSLNTSATTLFTLLAILLFGGSTVRPFAATLSVGILVGTYSSIAVATPLLTLWQERRLGAARR
jgi:preprotein translocase subunit SecF